MNTNRVALSLALLAPFLDGVPAAFGQSGLERVAQQLDGRAPADLPPPARQGSLDPLPGGPSLGVRVSPVTEEAIRAHQLVVRRGALITAVERDSPADRAGLPLGGVIVALDGRRIDSPDDLVQATRAARAGQEVELTFYQGDRLARRKVQLAGVQAPALLTVPGSAAPAPRAPAPPAPAPLDEPLIPPAPSPDTAPSGPASRLEREFGGGGARPILGQIGRILDGVIAPAQAFEPAPPTPVVRGDAPSEVTLLRQQVEQLRRQVEAMQRQLDRLETRIGSRP
jgi:hypothetical protein